MMNAMLFRRKHQLWLRIAYLSFSTSDLSFKSRLYEFSQIEFRHLKWLSESLYENGAPYDYSRDRAFTIEFATFTDAVRAAIEDIRSLHLLYTDSALCQRMRHDENFILTFLENSLTKAPQVFSAFERKRLWPDAPLTPEQTDALTLFLFEESYKEYELILVYLYRLARATTATQSSSFTDLIDESHFHLRSFAEMMAAMGILALPRELHPRTYEIDDMEKFLRNGITEEENAKEECQRLSLAITDPALSSFFECINFQESYHIEIMKKLLEEKLWKN